jgi:hypothetical protein
MASITQVPDDTGYEAAPASSLTFWKVALAIFVGNILTGVLAAILYALSRL